MKKENFNKITTDWYEKSYNKQGFGAQRKYPNEELMRFFGRNYFSIPIELRQTIKVLEVGCGSCGNLWVIAKEGFDSFGIDISNESINLGEQMLQKWDTKASLSVASMTDLPYENNYFDVICDVYSSYCLNNQQFNEYLEEVKRTLKPGGKIFSYTPSTKSDAFVNYSPAEKIDSNTLNGIFRESSPYFGNFYPFRFTNPDEIKTQYGNHGIEINYSELINRTYNNQSENFQFITLEGTKK